MGRDEEFSEFFTSRFDQARRTAPTASTWSPAALPARTPHGTWTPGWTAPPPPGRAVVDIPLCDLQFGATGPAPLGSVQLTAEFAKTLVKAVTDAARPAEVGQMHTKVHTSDRPGSTTRYSNFVDVTDSAGTGSVWFNAGAFRGTPIAAVENSGSPDLRDDPRQPEMWDHFGKGRGTLPLTEAQLTRIGLAVAEAV